MKGKKKIKQICLKLNQKSTKIVVIQNKKLLSYDFYLALIDQSSKESYNKTV